jgi:hypothetical protein
MRADELSAALEASVRSGDSSRALRALGGRALFVPYADPAPEPGAVAVLERPPEEIPLPVADGDSGRRYLLAFSSPHRLLECAGVDDAAWVVLPAAWLAARCPADAGLLIDSGSSCGLALGRGMLAELLLQSAGATTEWSITDASGRLRAGLPAEAHAEETSAVQRVASRHPEVAAVHRAAFGRNEDDGPVWLAFGFAANGDARLDAALEDAAVELASVTSDHVTLTAVGPGAPAGSAERFLFEQAPVIYSTSSEKAP